MSVRQWLQAPEVEAPAQLGQRRANVSGKNQRRRLTVQWPSHQSEILERRVLLSSDIVAFGAAQTFASNPLYNGPAIVADVNGDGKADFLVTNYNQAFGSTNPVFVLLGNGNGTFQPGHTFAANTPTRRLNIADVNSDGRPDLIIFGGSQVGIALGNGNGTFQPGQVVPDAGLASGLAIGDVNGDGKTDLVVARPGYTGTTVMLGNGDGTFQPLPTQFVPNPSSVFLADVNGDGRPDLVYGGYSNGTATAGVRVSLGNGDGTFQTAQTLAAPIALSNVVDVNGDGKPDLVSLSGVFLGNGNGTFQAPWTTSLPGFQPRLLNVIDLNGDGKPDLVESNPYGALFLRGNGDGSFRPQQVLPYTGFAADVNGDGLPDFLAVNNGAATVRLSKVLPSVESITRASPAGPVTVDNSVTYTVTFNEPVTGVGPTDFSPSLSGATATAPLAVTGSGAVYNVTVNGISGAGTLGLNFVNNGSIKDLAGDPYPPGGNISFDPQQVFGGDNVALADFNSDGHMDMAVDSPATGILTIFLGNGSGFVAGQTFSSSPSPITVADVNHDGRPDLMLTGGGYISLFLGNGDGTFKYSDIYTGYLINAATIADLNGDGNPDLIVATYSPQSISIFLGKGNGNFAASQTFSVRNPASIAVADVNGDGISDLVVANNYGSFPFGRVSILLGNSNGTFAPLFTIATGIVPTFITSADLNGDGKPDLVLSNPITDVFHPTSQSVGLLLGNGNGTFQPTQFIYAVTPRAVAVADINGDGRPDLVIPQAYPNNINVLLGNGNGTFQFAQSFGTGLYPTSAAIGDLNGDGAADVVVSNSRSNNLSVLYGHSTSFQGQTYTIVPPADVISNGSGSNLIALSRDSDGTDIDWVAGVQSGQLSITDPNGLTIDSTGGNDTITLAYTHGSPLPATLHLNGNFTINGLQGTNPLAGANLDIGRSTVFVGYSPSDPIAAIKSYLQNGYNNGAWNGTATALTGAIVSSATAANLNHTTTIGYADSADGTGVDTMPNTVELKYTLIGDANLDGQVNSADLQILLFGLNNPGAWDQGDFNYDGQVNSADLQELLFALNTSLGSQAAGTTEAAVGSTPVTAPATGSTPTQTSSTVTPTRGVPASSQVPPQQHLTRRGRRHR